jgi:branched-chain amino acid transport system permease protein
VSAGTQFYISGLLILFLLTVIAVWGLDLQYGVAGIYNFAFIIFQAAGAYVAGILALQPADVYQAQETYIGGFNLPFPLPLIGGAIAGGLLAIPVGFVGIRRLRGDYQAMAMLVLSLIATGFVQAQTGLFNGVTGLSFIPAPLADQLNLSRVDYQWMYAGITGVFCLLSFLLMRAIVRSPFGRLLRAIRDSDVAASALGRDANRTRMVAFVIGGCLAGLSGGLLAQYTSAWAPGSWLYPETFLLFTAIVVGGSGNLLGGALGALLVPIAILEGTRFLPDIGYPGLTASLDWVVIGLVLLAFLWWRPTGLVPERRRRGARLPSPFFLGGGGGLSWLPGRRTAATAPALGVAADTESDQL